MPNRENIQDCSNPGNCWVTPPILFDAGLCEEDAYQGEVPWPHSVVVCKLPMEGIGDHNSASGICCSLPRFRDTHQGTWTAVRIMAGGVSAPLQGFSL